MRVRVTPRARGDIEIRRYLRKRSPSGARNVFRSIYSAIQFIGQNPRAAEETDETGVRVKVIVEYPKNLLQHRCRHGRDCPHPTFGARAVERGVMSRRTVPSMTILGKVGDCELKVTAGSVRGMPPMDMDVNSIDSRIRRHQLLPDCRNLKERVDGPKHQPPSGVEEPA